jgi:hypothetical protein
MLCARLLSVLWLANAVDILGSSQDASDLLHSLPSSFYAQVTTTEAWSYGPADDIDTLALRIVLR